MQPTPRVRRALVLLAAGAAAALAGALAARHESARGPAPVTHEAHVYREPRALPEFALTAADGARFGRAQLTGHWTLLTFGYSHCPDTCPATLAELARVRRELAAPGPVRPPWIVFVTLDPEHDTPQRLAVYLAQFNASFAGLTGAAATLATLAQALGATALAAAPAADGYRVAHSSAVYLIDPAARLAAEFPAPAAARTLAADYRAIVRAGGG